MGDEFIKVRQTLMHLLKMNCSKLTVSFVRFEDKINHAAVKSVFVYIKVSRCEYKLYLPRHTH